LGYVIVCNKIDNITIQDFEREIDYLMKVSHHENIVKYLFHCFNSDDNTLRFYMELLPSNLDSVIVKRRNDNLPPFSLKSTIFILSKLSNALNYLHQLNPPMIHRDIKPQNIFVSIDLQGPVDIKLGDFGISKILTERAKTYIGTREYMAPEIHYNEDQEYDENVDIFAFGIVMYFILTQNDPPENPRDITLDDIPEQTIILSDLLLECTNTDPKLRPSAQNILIYLSNIDSQSNNN